MGEWLRNNPTNNPTNTISRVSRRGLSGWEWLGDEPTNTISRVSRRGLSGCVLLRNNPTNGRMASEQSNEQSNEHNFASILKGTQRMGVLLRNKPMDGRMALQQSNEQSNEYNFASLPQGTQRMCMASRFGWGLLALLVILEGVASNKNNSIAAQLFFMPLSAALALDQKGSGQIC